MFHVVLQGVRRRFMVGNWLSREPVCLLYVQRLSGPGQSILLLIA